MLDAAGALVGVSPRLLQVYALRRLAPDFRERIWVAVSAANQCRHCSFIHQKWAQKLGVTVEEIRAMARADLSHEERTIAVAIDYALEWVYGGLDAVSAASTQDFARHFLPAEQAQIRAVVRLATLANLTGNTFDAFLARLRGRPTAGSRAFDEAAVSLIFATVAAVVVMAIVVIERKSPLAVLREFRAFSKGAFSTAKPL